MPKRKASSLPINLARRIYEICNDALIKPHELLNGNTPAYAIVVNAINICYAFHPSRLEHHRAYVTEMMQSLHYKDFKSTGMSILGLYGDKNEIVWAEDIDIENLCALAIGLELAEWTFPRDTWGILPAGKPYITFKLTLTKESQ